MLIAQSLLRLLHTFKETQMVYQHTTNTKQVQIKLKVEQFQQLQQTYYREILILHNNSQEFQTLEVMVNLL